MNRELLHPSARADQIFARSGESGAPHRARRAPSRRLLITRFLLVLLGFATPLLLMELGLRWFRPFLPGEYQTAAFAAPSQVTGRSNRGNTAGWAHGPDYTTWVRINSKGLRGPEVAYAKEPGAYRIMVLGDSFTFAHQVAEEQTFTTRLAERLREARPGQQFETINTGTNGWSTANEYAWLTSEGYRYQPDLVLLMFDVGNDPAGNAKHVGSPERVDQRTFQLGDGRAFRELRRGLSEVSVLWNVVEWTVFARLETREDVSLKVGGTISQSDLLEPEVGSSSLNTEEKRRGWAISEALLARMRDFCAAQRINLVVVSIPAYGVVVDPERRVSPLPAISGRVGLPLIDLLDPFREQPRRVRQRLYLENDLHWTAEGHATAARAVAAELLRHGLLPTADH